MAKINYDQNKIRPAYSSVVRKLSYLDKLFGFSTVCKKKFRNIEIIFNYIAENSIKKMLDGWSAV